MKLTKNLFGEFGIILFLALVVRLAYTVGLYLGMGPEGLLVEDSTLYLKSANDFLKNGDFVKNVSDTIVVPETERMPLYIIFLSLHQFISGNINSLFPALTQAFIGAGACVVIAKIGALLNPKLGQPAGLIAAFNPTLIIVGANILTDGLFFLLISLGLLFSIKWLRSPSWKSALYIGIFLALAISTRAMAFPWAIFCILALPIGVLFLQKFKFKYIWHMFLAGLIIVVFQSPIVIRNLDKFDSWHLTSQGGTYALNWIVPLVLEVDSGTPQAIGSAKMRELHLDKYGDSLSSNPFVQSKQMTDVAKIALWETDSKSIIKAWVIGAGINLFSPAPIVSPPIKDIPRTGFYDVPGENKFNKIKSFIFNNDSPIYSSILVISLVGIVIVRIAQIFGLISIFSCTKHLSNKNDRLFQRIAFSFLTLWAFYVLLINGPIASPKYRMPLESVAIISLAMFYVGFASHWMKKLKQLL
ncbi:MAG: hypothetical protein CMM30_02995 [Rhodospirillaceae bacterium]|nr:hypothetical protein [Rhodospirillaceae bacterium]